MDCSPPGSSVHGVLQTRILEWITMSSSRGSSRPRDQTRVFYVSCIGRQALTSEPPGKTSLLRSASSRSWSLSGSGRQVIMKVECHRAGFFNLSNIDIWGQIIPDQNNNVETVLCITGCSSASLCVPVASAPKMSPDFDR
ncbi:hypothetical protein R6Z07M_016694 [Ovis aries]